MIGFPRRLSAHGDSATKRAAAFSQTAVFWWFVGVAMLNWLKVWDDPSITRGDVLAIAIPIVIAAGWWGYHTWKRRVTFGMWFTSMPPDVPEPLGYRRKRRTKWVAPIGRSIVFMPVYHRLGGSVSWFRVSLGHRDYHFDQPDRWRLGWRPENPNTVKVVDVHIGGKRGEEFDYFVVRDRHEGIDIKMRTPLQWFRAEPLFLEVVIESDVEWSGRISFYGDNGSFYRPSATRRLHITDRIDSYGAGWARADNPKQPVSRKAETSPAQGA